MKTLVNVVAEWQDGLKHERYDYQYLMPGKLEAGEAEELLRGGVDDFFARAGESYIREAWEESMGDLNWGDVLGQGYGTMYFEANGIEGVVPGKTITADAYVTVFLRHDERLFPEEWAGKMAALDDEGAGE